MPIHRRLLLAASLLAPLSLPAGPVEAQARPAHDVRSEVFVNSELESYLRLLQLRGAAAPYPWSIRAFSPGEVEGLAPADSLAHPWGQRFDFSPGGEGGGVSLVAPRAQLFYNSAVPYGFNDGPVWQGKGVTAAVEGGVAMRWGPLSLTLAPMVFVAQNAEFELLATGRPGKGAFADPDNPTTIDLPQRFGDGAYVRVDPGQSTLRVDAGPVALGASTANQHWGPAVDHPLILGNNAAGFPHAFVGTSRPADLWIGRLHGRVVWGLLDQSDYTALRGDSARRFMSGVAAVFTPRGMDGLEVGAARFFHTRWVDFDAGDYLKPFQGLLKAGTGQTGPGFDRSDPDNQLASAFFRWVLPRSAFEVYGEYAREDHNVDLRDLVLEPDHDSAFLLGFQKAWGRREGAWTVLRGEWMDAQVSHLQLARAQTRFYRHVPVLQGHTQGGQVLGSAAAYGGAAAVLAVDRYTPAGRWTLEWSRSLRGERPPTTAGDPGAELNVVHALGAEALLFRRGLDLRLGASGVYEANRGYRDDDLFNVNLSVAGVVRM